MTDNDNYTCKLFSLISKSDMTNRDKLRKVYPYEVQAVDKFQNEEGYWDSVLESIGKGTK